VLRTEYSSVVEPIVRYIDQVCAVADEQVVVLIPMIVPTRLRYSFLHNHLDLVLSNALRERPYVIVARVSMPLDPQPAGPASVAPAEGSAPRPVVG
jgi:hypothetical protein